jgi:hypothetical protein
MRSQPGDLGSLNGREFFSASVRASFPTTDFRRWRFRTFLDFASRDLGNQDGTAYRVGWSFLASRSYWHPLSLSRTASPFSTFPINIGLFVAIIAAENC